MKIRYHFLKVVAAVLFCTASVWGQDGRITIDPQSVNANVPVGGNTSATITLGNSGTGELQWNIFEDDPSALLQANQTGSVQVMRSPFKSAASDAYQPIANPILPKGATDARRGPQIFQGLGGPDAFGYMFIDSDEPGGPAFDFIDLRSTPGAITLPLGDDDSFTLQLPASFPYYGENKRSITIGSNGYISFSGNGNEAQNTAIPDPAVPNDMLAVFWDDLDPRAGSARVQFFFNNSTRETIVQYSDVPRFGSTAPNTFQVILRPDGKILYQYLSMAGVVNQATVGIEDPNGSTGLQAAFNTDYIHDNMAILFSPGCSWLATTPISGSIAPGGAQSVTVEMDAAGLPAGIYNCNLLVNSTDPLQEQIVVPVEFIVGPPIIVVSPLSLQYGDVIVGNNAAQTVSVRNDGVLELDVNSTDFTGTNPADFAILNGGAPFTLLSGESRDVSVAFAPQGAGGRSADLQFASNDPNTQIVDVSLAGTGLTPEITVTPEFNDFGDIKVLGVVSQNFMVSNDGTADLAVSGFSLTGPNAGEFSIFSGGLPISLAPGESHIVTVNFSPVAEGAKAAVLRIDNNDIDENPFEVPLTGNGTVPDIMVTPGSHNYGNVLLGEGASQTFTVSNAGAAALIVASTTLSGTEAGDYNISSGGGTFILAPGVSENIVVDFAPGALGVRNASLTIVSDDPDESNTSIPLSGTGVTPEISVTPSSHVFGSVRLGESAQQTFVVANSGTADLIVTATSFIGLGADQYSISSGGGAFLLIPGATRDIVIDFSPTSVGTKDAVLLIDNNDLDENPFDIPITGTGVTPEIAVEPTSKDFGTIRLSESAAQNFLVRNEGNIDLNIASIMVIGRNASEFPLTAGGTPVVIAPGDSHIVSMSFIPASVGQKSATLQIVNDDLDENPFDVPVSGNAVTPEIAVTPSAKNYGNVKVQTSASQSFSVRNEGTAPLDVSSIQLIGANAAEFSIASGGEPVVIAPGDSHAVVVNFSPASEGAKAATLQLANDDLDENPFNVALSGNGVVPEIAVSPLSHDYGDVRIGESPQQSFNIANVGEAQLVVTATNLIGADASQFNIVSGGGMFVLPPGMAQNISVSFSPDSLGQKSAMLQILSDDPGGMTIDLPLTGMGITPEIAISPSSHDFGEVRRDSVALNTFTVSNSGNADLNVSAATLSGDNADQFSILSGGAPFTLIPGASRSIVVSFVPTSVGFKNAVLVIENDDLDENPINVGLSGKAIAPDIALQPDSLGFGTLQTGQSIARAAVVSNVGDAPLQVNNVSITGVDTADFRILSNDSSFVLQPGETREMSIGFSPALVGLKTASLRIESDDLDENPFTVPLTGNAVAETIQVVKVSPSFYDFGDVPILESELQAFQIINEGTANLVLDSTAIAGPNASKFSVNLDSIGMKILPGDTLPVIVAFNPDSVGIFSADLKVFNNDPDEPELTVPLNGTGIVAPNIVVEPDSQDFGAVFAGNSVAQTFLILNTGFLDLVVNSMNTAGNNASEFAITSGDSSFVLAPGDSQNVTVNFTPLTPGQKTASLQVFSNDPNQNPFSVALTGMGVVSDIAVAPDTLNLGDAGVDSTVTAPLLLINKASATADLIVTSFLIQQGESSEFAIAGGNVPFTLAPGDTQVVTFSFSPTSTGSKSDTLTIISNDPDQGKLTVPLDGRGIIELAHDFLLLGDFKVSFDNHAGSEGDAHSNVDMSFRGTSSVVTHTGNISAVDDIELRANNLVVGDATAGDKVEVGGTVTGTVTANANVPVEVIPTFSFTAGGENIEHNSGDTLTLAPGSYGEVLVADQSVLVLTAGTYFMNRLKVDNNSFLSANVSEGLITVNVVDDFDIDSDAEISTFPSDAVDEFSTEKLTFNTLQEDDMDIGNRVTLVGSINAPNAEVTMGQNSRLKGAICAYRIRLKSGSSAIHHSSEVPVSGLLAKGAAGEEDLSALPEKFELKQNYPNPFNPTTTIEYSVAFENTPVKIEIYDVTGRRVRTLVNEVQAPGFYKIEWDGYNEHKVKVAGGFYVYRMIAGSFVENRKMMLVK